MFELNHYNFFGSHQNGKLNYLNPYTGLWNDQDRNFLWAERLEEDSNYRSTLGGLLSTSSSKYLFKALPKDNGVTEGFRGVINYFEQYLGHKST